MLLSDASFRHPKLLVLLLSRNKRLTPLFAIQVKGGGIGPGRGAKIFDQVVEIFPAGALTRDDLRNIYNEVSKSSSCYMGTTCTHPNWLTNGGPEEYHTMVVQG